MEFNPTYERGSGAVKNSKPEKRADPPSNRPPQPPSLQEKYNSGKNDSGKVLLTFVLLSPPDSFFSRKAGSRQPSQFDRIAYSRCFCRIMDLFSREREYLPIIIIPDQNEHFRPRNNYELFTPKKNTIR